MFEYRCNVQVGIKLKQFLNQNLWCPYKCDASSYKFIITSMYDFSDDLIGQIYKRNGDLQAVNGIILQKLSSDYGGFC